MFGPAFTAGLAGVAFRSDWPLHVAGPDENDAHISASSQVSGWEAWRAHGGGEWHAGAAGGDQWIQVRFESLRRATHYDVGDTGGGSWNYLASVQLRGSNDGVDWVDLDTPQVMSATGGAHNSIVNRAVPSPSQFLFYRIYVITCVPNAGGGTFGCGEWGFTFSTG